MRKNSERVSRSRLLARGIVLYFLIFLLTAPLRAQEVSVPLLRVAILGNPVVKVEWTDRALESLRKIGFNAIQVNIAWGTQPFNEALNLEDIVTIPGEAESPIIAARRKELQSRAAMAKRHGFRTIFQFGSPYINWNPYTGKLRPGLPYWFDDTTYDTWYDIRNPRVVQHACALLEEFRKQLPDIDDIEVYTYDQAAWQTPEFQEGTYSFAIPLADRLPGYLKQLDEVWTQGRTSAHRMWWEPWELSAGQIYTILPQLPRTGFGLMIHANIAEAQLALPVDIWVRNTVRICRNFGIPVIVETFWASRTEEIEPLSIPAPRLVDEGYLRIMGSPGITGIKEYYGIIPEIIDPDLEVLQLRLGGFLGTTDELLTRITRHYGSAQQDVKQYFGFVSDALQMYPWDATWRARSAGVPFPDHGWAGATILGAQANTPSWRSSRAAHFMKTDNVQAPFWMLEDVQLRCQIAAQNIEEALRLGQKIIGEVPDPKQKAYFEKTQKDIDYFRRMSVNYALHLRETNVAEMLRMDIKANKPLNPRLIVEMKHLLDTDVLNELPCGNCLGGRSQAEEMRRLFQESPAAFVQRYLVPTDVTTYSKGSFAFTTR